MKWLGYLERIESVGSNTQFKIKDKVTDKEIIISVRDKDEKEYLDWMLNLSLKLNPCIPTIYNKDGFHVLKITGTLERETETQIYVTGKCSYNYIIKEG